MTARTVRALLCCLVVFVIVSPHGKAQEQRVTAMTSDAPHLVSPLAVISRDKSSKEAFLEVKPPEPWSLFAGKTAEDIDYSRPFLHGEGPGVFSVPQAGNRHSLFALRMREGTLLLAERLLPMSGGGNFRDLGGIRTKDGRCVAWGLFFRADDLAMLTHEDQAYLTSIPLRTVVDFRAADEAARAPDKIPASVEQTLAYPVTLARIDPRTIEQELEGTNADDFMKDIYRQLVLNDEVKTAHPVKEYFAS